MLFLPKSFLYVIRICLKISVKLNSSRLEVFRLNRFGLGGTGLNRIGLITCEKWDLCWSATLPWNLAGKNALSTIGLVCVGETVGKIGEVDEMGERELVLVVSVKCGKDRDMTRG